MSEPTHISRRTGARGFTAVELVTVIVIIGIIGAIAGPKFFGRNAFSEMGYADEIAAAMRQSQKVAVASGCPVQLTINAAGYQAMQRAAAGGTCSSSGAWNVPVMRTDGTSLSGSAPGDANVNTNATLEFSASGASNINTSISVGTHTISVSAVTGFVEVT